MIIVLSDFSVQGSGYQRIMTRLCDCLVKDHELGILALGLGYNGEEHFWPYSIVPVPHISHVPHMINRLRSYGAPIEAVFVALDIPIQEAMLDALQMPGPVPYIGLFPLEAPPLCQNWAIQLLKMDARLVMSQFGQVELDRAGVPATFLPIGIDDPNRWQPPDPEKRQFIRQGLGLDDDTFMILTVADNQERKNLSRTAEIVSKLSVSIESYAPNGFVMQKTEKRKVAWYVVTRINSPVGWKLDDLGMRLGIMDRMAMFNRGVPDQELWQLFAAADCFLLTSKAEGLAVPVLEAMACRVPVAGTNCTAMKEHLSGGRGWLIEPDYDYIDPFGNGLRYWASVDHGVTVLEDIIRLQGSEEYHAILDKAQSHVNDRTWEKAADVVAGVIDEVTTRKGTRLEHGEKAQTAAIPELAP